MAMGATVAQDRAENDLEMEDKVKPSSYPKVRIFYDHGLRKLNVVDLASDESHLMAGLVIRNATFIIEEGVRGGCVGTGYLGFIHGERVSGAEMSAAELRRVVVGIEQAKPVFWDGVRFITHDERLHPVRIDSAKTLFLAGSSMLAFTS